MVNDWEINWATHTLEDISFIDPAVLELAVCNIVVWCYNITVCSGVQFIPLKINIFNHYCTGKLSPTLVKNEKENLLRRNSQWDHHTPVFLPQVVYKNNDIRLELSRLARIVDPKMKLQGDVVFKCENVPTLDPINFENPDSYLALPKWNTKRVGSISFDFRTSEPNGLILFTHGKPQDRRDAKGQKNNKVDFFAVELLDGGLYLLLDMGSGTIKVKATQAKVNDGAWHHVDIQRDGRSGKNEREGRENSF